MKPVPGKYRLTSDAQPGTPPVPPMDLTLRVRAPVDGDGADSALGYLAWVAATGSFQHAKLDVWIQCLGNNRFVAIVRPGEPDEETYEGSCIVMVG